MSRSIGVAPLAGIRSAAQFGGKAFHLAEAVRAGLPVPAGIGIPANVVDQVIAGHADAVREVRGAIADLGVPVAVRSSAVGEDGARTSFAGIHESQLNLTDVSRAMSAIATVARSATTEAAHDYRRRLAIAGGPRMAVLVQHMIDADRSGVLFTRNPVTGANEIVIEAAWGLGCAIVGGHVTPDHFRIDREGRLLERRLGAKTCQDRATSEGGTERRPVAPECVRSSCLEASHLDALRELAARCADTAGAAIDLEWSFSGELLHLLQVRPITTL